MDNKNTIYTTLVAALLFFIWFFVWPSIQLLSDFNRELKNSREDLVLLETAKDQLQQESELFASISASDKQLVELAAPLSQDRTGLINLLNDLAGNNGLVVDSMSIAEETAAARRASTDALASMSVTLSLEGAYNSLKVFVDALEQSLRVFEIESVDIAASQDEDLAQFIVRVKAYYAK